MVSFHVFRLAVTAMCLGSSAFSFPTGDSSVAKSHVNKRWDFRWIILPQEYEDAVDENGNVKVSDAPFDLDKIDPNKLAEAAAAEAGDAARN
ncbi:hypothetical protein DHEL01_v211292 [Diaporthe helianthi]|uniref:Uncharacterized protein n=1 Tax=Diaporthe helianthi TaxID=158607 RepID=A0A2P5HJ96_DIAHE|nr:hypothetical protein DHEL01_v211292 [Diaporthe helianthi]